MNSHVTKRFWLDHIRLKFLPLVWKQHCIHDLLRCCINTRCSSNAAAPMVFSACLFGIFPKSAAHFQIQSSIRRRQIRANVNWLTWLIKCASHKSKLTLKACWFPLFCESDWPRWLITVFSLLTAHWAETPQCFPLLSISFDPRDSFRGWYDLSFGVCVCARSTLG